MSRREGIVRTSVRPLALDGIFQAIDHTGHDGNRKGIGRNHLSPGASPFHSSQLHPQHSRNRSILKIIVKFIGESGDMGIPCPLNLFINRQSQCA